MARERKKLALSKGAAFAKGRLKRLPQEGDTGEADFRALPKPLSKNETHYLGLVVVQGEGSVLAKEQVGHTPDVNDLARLGNGTLYRATIEAVADPAPPTTPPRAWRETTGRGPPFMLL